MKIRWTQIKTKARRSTNEHEFSRIKDGLSLFVLFRVHSWMFLNWIICGKYFFGFAAKNLRGGGTNECESLYPYATDIRCGLVVAAGGDRRPLGQSE